MKQEDVDGVIDFATQTFGQLDILVNNEGIMDNFTPVGNLTDAEYERVMAINLTGPVKLCRAAYTMVKHALVGLTKNIAGTYGRFGKVRANAIAPGGVATNIQTTITAPDPLGMQALQATGEPPNWSTETNCQLSPLLGLRRSKFYQRRHRQGRWGLDG